MDRRNLCMALVSVLLLSTSFIAGCTDPFSRRIGCTDCGCRYDGTVFRPEGQATLTINGSDIAHASAFASTEFFLGLPRTDYQFKMIQVIAATNTTPERIIYDISFGGPTDVSPAFKVPMKAWTNYSVNLHTEYSTDPYVQNMTFFNGGNDIHVKLWNDQSGDVLNVTVDPTIKGISVNQTDRSDNILHVGTAQWTFDIKVQNENICID